MSDSPIKFSSSPSSSEDDLPTHQSSDEDISSDDQDDADTEDDSDFASPPPK
jgi:hypothetical protein